MLGELSTLTRDLLLRKTAPEGGAALLSGGFDSATLDKLGKRRSRQSVFVSGLHSAKGGGRSLLQRRPAHRRGALPAAAVRREPVRRSDCTGKSDHPTGKRGGSGRGDPFLPSPAASPLQRDAAPVLSPGIRGRKPLFRCDKTGPNAPGGSSFRACAGGRSAPVGRAAAAGGAAHPREEPGERVFDIPADRRACPILPPPRPHRPQSAPPQLGRLPPVPAAPKPQATAAPVTGSANWWRSLARESARAAAAHVPGFSGVVRRHAGGRSGHSICPGRDHAEPAGQRPGAWVFLSAEVEKVLRPAGAWFCSG